MKMLDLEKNFLGGTLKAVKSLPSANDLIRRQKTRPLRQTRYDNLRVELLIKPTHPRLLPLFQVISSNSSFLCV